MNLKRLAIFASLLVPLNACAGGASQSVTSATLPATGQYGIFHAVTLPHWETPYALDGDLYLSTDKQEGVGLYGSLEEYKGRNLQLVGTIAGATSGISEPGGVAVDKNGNIFIGNNFAQNSGNWSITRYPPKQFGDIPPSAVITEGVGWVYDMALDGKGNIYVAQEMMPNGVYKPGSSSQYTERRTLGTFTGTGIALDEKGRIYISTFGGSNGNGTLYVFSRGGAGSSSPIGSITGSTTEMYQPRGVAIDKSGAIYVAQSEGPAITVYAPGTINGNVAPSRVIYGSNTLLDFPETLALDSNGYLYVNCRGDRVLVFAPNANGNIAPVAQWPFSFVMMALKPKPR